VNVLRWVKADDVTQEVIILIGEFALIRQEEAKIFVWYVFGFSDVGVGYA